MTIIIQDMIDKAQPNDIVVVPWGTYDVDGVNSPIRMKSYITLDLTAAVINILPTTLTDRMWFGIVLYDCVNSVVKGGTILGNRSKHPADNNPAVGGLGMGIAIGGGSQNVKILDTQVADCFGDGILITGGQGVELGNVALTHNRRQGLSMSQVNGLWVHDSHISYNGGAPPGAGIDIEPDLSFQQVTNVQITHNTFLRNAGAGVLIACPPAQRHNINISVDNIFIGKPIDGTDGIVPFWAKWLAQIGIGGYVGYPRSLYLA